MEEKNEILKLWNKYMNNVDSDNYEEKIKEAYIKAMNTAHDGMSGWGVNIYANGSVSNMMDNNSSISCNWHSSHISCPDCHSIYFVESWSILDYQDYTEESPTGETKENHLWCYSTDEFILESEAIDFEIEDLIINDKIDEIIEDTKTEIIEIIETLELRKIKSINIGNNSDTATIGLYED